MFADENTEVSFPSSNLVAGKITVGVDKSVLKEKLVNLQKQYNEEEFIAQ